MPQAARKDVAAQRAQDKESKRARGAMSCAECRRLKLKCDKNVPCASCVRRGCSAICPNGSLITGQGTRFVLADTEKLHQKIAHMSDRIRQLEDALSILQSTLTAEPHPLLSRELLTIKSSIELHSAVENSDGRLPPEETEESQYIDAFGTLAIRDDGASTFYGRSAGSESLLIGETSTPRTPQSPHERQPNQGQPWPSQLSPSITNLSSSFPLASGTPGITLDTLLDSYLPPWREAWRLSEGYLESAPWFFGPVTKKQLHEEILPMWYAEARLNTNLSPGENTLSVNLPGTTPIAMKAGSHELALMFAIFCFGALTDVSLPPAPDNPDSDRYFKLTRAALTLEPVLDRPPSVCTVQALSLMAIYQGLASGENSIESTWALMGLATKLAQSIGLHRDCARWKLSPGEVQKRRALFWELFITDCWQSLATGRLATFSLAFVDAELPYDSEQTMSDDGTTQPSFSFWKAQFGADCVSAVVQGTLTSRAPKYSIILELDRKIRDMELPKYAHGPPPQGVGFAQTMLHFMPINYRELTLLYIHRCFFAHAITSHPMDPIKSQYAPSFLAGYRSACELVGALKVQFLMFPAQTARYWVLWTHAFSSAVMLSSVVTRSAQSKVAPAALLELRNACDLFEKAATYGGRAVKFLPILQRLQEKAHQTYLQMHSGQPQAIPNDIFTPSQKEIKKDELSIFSGQTHTVTTKVSMPSLRGSRSSPTSATSSALPSSKSSGNTSPSQKHALVPSFAGVHPSLVDQLRGFDGHLHAQIHHAYYVNHDALARTLLENQAYTTNVSPPEQHQQVFNRQPSPPEQHQQVFPRQTSPPEQHKQGFNPQASPLEHRMQGMPPPVSASHPQMAPAVGQSPHQYHPQQAQQFHQMYNPPNPVYDQPHQHHSVAPQVQQHHQQQYASPPAPYNTPHPHYQSPPVSHAQNPYWQNQAVQAQDYHKPEMMAYPQHGYLHPVPQHYTPGGALSGIAADDNSLQDTWQSFMNQVGSPQRYLDD